MALGIERLAGLLDSSYLNLIIFPTEKCNFRCTYCYEDFKHGRMPADVIEGIEALLARRATELRQLDLSWFGGEPLLASDIVLRLSRFACELSADNGIAYRGYMTTNGYLLRGALCKDLALAGVTNFQISLDGLGDTHNKTRRRADGNGTFDRIWQNLLGIHHSDLEIEVLLRIHVAPGNASELHELIELVNEELGDDSRFSILFRSVANLGGAQDQTFQIYHRGESAEVTHQLTQMVKHSDRLVGEEVFKEYICYASMPNSLAIRSDGTIAKCTVALSDERNAVGKLSSDGSVLIDQQKMRFWIRGLESQDPLTLECPLVSTL